MRENRKVTAPTTNPIFLEVSMKLLENLTLCSEKSRWMVHFLLRQDLCFDPRLTAVFIEDVLLVNGSISVSVSTVFI